MRRKYVLGLTTLLAACNLFILRAGNSALAQTARNAINYPAGWSMVAFPPGTDLSGVPGLLYTLQPSDQNYQTSSPSQGTTSGLGYWVYFSSPTIVMLAPGSNPSMQVNAPAGEWVMAGDPSGTVPARVTGATYVFLYNTSGGAYVQDATLQPGEGAWVYSTTGGTIQLTTAPSPQSCGTVSSSGSGPTPTTTATGAASAQAAETCFMQGLQPCSSVSLTWVFTGPPDTGHTQHVFMLDNSGGGVCVITDTTTLFPGFVAPSQQFPRTSYYFCSGVSQASSGLVFTGCGSEGTVTVPSS